MNHKLIISISFAVVIIFAPLFSLAARKDEIDEKRDELRRTILEQRRSIKNGVMKRKESRQGDMATGTSMMDARKKERDDFRQKIREGRHTLKKELEVQKENFKLNGDRRNDALQKKFGEHKAERIEELFDGMIRKFEKVISNLRVISDKVGGRIDRVAGGGADVDEYREKLADADEKISAAERILEEIKAKFDQSSQSQNLKTELKSIKSLTKDFTATIKEAHGALLVVLKDMKGTENAEEFEETTRATTTTP